MSHHAAFADVIHAPLLVHLSTQQVHERGSDGGLPHSGPHGERWWHIFHSNYSELRAFGFSPSGQTLAIATSSDLSPWTRRTAHGRDCGAEG